MKVKYREISRKANVGERIRIVNAITATNAYANGDEMTVKTRWDHTPRGVHTNEQPVFVYDKEYVVLEPVTPAPPKQLDFPDELTQSLALFICENASAIRKYLDQIDPPTPPKPAPLTRAEIIAKAKADVAELIRIGDDFLRKLPQGPFQTQYYAVEFHVNREKRAVTALVRSRYGDTKTILAKATAKAAPGDVFHAEIGKAIALRRALGLTVPDEYVNAPKPDEPRVGAKVRKTTGHNVGTTLTLEHRTTWNDGDIFGNYAFTTVESFGWIADKQYEVIDDTDVDYSVDGVTITEGSAA